MSGEPKRRISGTVAAAAFRKKADSVEVHTIPMLDALNAQIDSMTERVRRTTPPQGTTAPELPPESPLPRVELDSVPEVTPVPATKPSVGCEKQGTPACPMYKDPRREPMADSRRDDLIPIDVVEPDPFPSSKKGTRQ